MQTHFAETKRAFKKVIQDVSAKGKGRHDLLEAAFFAYAHRNPVIDYIFWKRLRVAEEFVLSKNPQKVLDFGSGSGVMSYCLGRAGIQVTGFDIDQKPLEEVRPYIEFPQSIEFIGEIQMADSRYDTAFNCIVALDVLEHIEDLTDFVVLAKRVLKKDGLVVVSGPTENLFYKIGRKVAGKQFTGTYHVSNISRIRTRLAQDMEIIPIKTIFPLMPLFELFAARPKV